MNILIIKIRQFNSVVRVFGSKFLRIFELAILRAEWDIKNKNNDTYPVSYFPINLVTIGDYTYGPINVYTYESWNEGLEIGKYCSIARDVKFILGGNHKTDCLMTFPLLNKFGGNNVNDATSKGKIILEDDVWIGVGSTVLSGVRLGQGCVVAAGSVVSKSFPPFALIGGVPAKIIKMRFEDEVINKLKNEDIKLGKIHPSEIMQVIDSFNIPLNKESVDDLIFILKKNGFFK
ncbi:acetyltransferase-like isoleucine patch superfamily enzyme [Flavobacterium sp. PL11]|uniref:CatB-related O-acetyltransferase n=1 Tax=Flavobacterium sp. PL11 TaxID=3071717 RepID=UPI002E00EE50|nr:acetyltransferase-like isoleucine patch superfamily enzyme [Flavobacterium sp. PL11]